MRSLNVYIDTALVGVLREEEDLWRFEYDAKWVTVPDGYDLAPGLPRAQSPHIDGSTTRPVQWYFDNLLPEESLRQAISKEAKVKGADAFALLEYLGAESAGSLTLLPPGTLPGGKPNIRELSDQTLSRRIADLPIQTLAATAPKRMASGWPSTTTCWSREPITRRRSLRIRRVGRTCAWPLRYQVQIRLGK